MSRQDIYNVHVHYVQGNVYDCCWFFFYLLCLPAGGKGNETAEEYFQRVMDTTSTVILWPSRLKIGAKSKKVLYI